MQSAVLSRSYDPVEEVQLESEGAPSRGAGVFPLPAAPPAPARSVGAGDVVEFSISARESFEVFMGKRYDPSQFAWGLSEDAVLHLQEAVTPSHAAFDRLAAHLSSRLAAGRAPPGSSPGEPPRQPQSPLDRFARLLSGLQALQAELGEVGSAAEGGAGGLHRVLAAATAGAQERLLALKPAAAAAALAGGGGALGGGGPVARPAPVDASVFKALALDAAALLEAQAQAEQAQARVKALTAALHERIRGLERR